MKGVENSNSGHWVNSRNQGAKRKTVCHVEFRDYISLTQKVNSSTYYKSGNCCSKNSK